MPLLKCRNFLACLPLRSGIWILGLVGLVVAGFGAAGSVMEIMLLSSHPVSSLYKIALFVQTGSMGLFGILSILGILAAILNTHGLAFIYGKVLILDVAVTVPALAFSLFATLKPISDGDVKACLNGDTTQTVSEFCSSGLSVVKGFGVALVFVIILIQFYAFVIASNWADQLFSDSAAYVDRSLDFSDSGEKGLSPSYTLPEFSRGGTPDLKRGPNSIRSANTEFSRVGTPDFTRGPNSIRGAGLEFSRGGTPDLTRGPNSIRGPSPEFNRGLNYSRGPTPDFGRDPSYRAPTPDLIRGQNVSRGPTPDAARGYNNWPMRFQDTTGKMYGGPGGY